MGEKNSRKNSIPCDVRWLGASCWHIFFFRDKAARRRCSLDTVHRRELEKDSAQVGQLYRGAISGYNYEFEI